MAQITASVVVALVAALAPLRAQTSLSIYSDGRVVVRRALPQPLQKGQILLAEGSQGHLVFHGHLGVGRVTASSAIRPVRRKSSVINA